MKRNTNYAEITAKYVTGLRCLSRSVGARGRDFVNHPRSNIMIVRKYDNYPTSTHNNREQLKLVLVKHLV